jgi:hypothetical protein
MTQSAQEAAEIPRARAYAGRVIDGVEALVPEDADPTEARDFVGVARSYLAQLASARHRSRPRT